MFIYHQVARQSLLGGPNRQVARPNLLGQPIPSLRIGGGVGEERRDNKLMNLLVSFHNDRLICQCRSNND